MYSKPISDNKTPSGELRLSADPAPARRRPDADPTPTGRRPDAGRKKNDTIRAQEGKEETLAIASGN